MLNLKSRGFPLLDCSNMLNLNDRVTLNILDVIVDMEIDDLLKTDQKPNSV